MSQTAVDMDQVQAFFEQWSAAWNDRDPSRISKLFTEEGEWQDPIFPTPAIGRPQIAENLRAVFHALPDFHLEILDIYGDTHGGAADRYRITGTASGPMEPPGLAPTNQPVAIEGAAFFEFDGGLVLKCRVVFDMLDLGRQIGAVPQPGTLGDRLGSLMQKRVARRMRRQAASG